MNDKTRENLQSSKNTQKFQHNENSSAHESLRTGHNRRTITNSSAINKRPYFWRRHNNSADINLWSAFMGNCETEGLSSSHLHNTVFNLRESNERNRKTL